MPNIFNPTPPREEHSVKSGVKLFLAFLRSISYQGGDYRLYRFCLLLKYSMGYDAFGAPAPPSYQAIYDVITQTGYILVTAEAMPSLINYSYKHIDYMYSKHTQDQCRPGLSRCYHPLAKSYEALTVRHSTPPPPSPLPNHEPTASPSQQQNRQTSRPFTPISQYRRTIPPGRAGMVVGISQTNLNLVCGSKAKRHYDKKSKPPNQT